MVRFSCFPTNTHCHKPKKEVQRSTESMRKALQDCSQDWKLKASGVPSSPSLDQCNKSEEIHDNFIPEVNMDVGQRGYLRKSQSLGSALDREGRVSSGSDYEDHVDQGFSSNHFHEHNQAGNYGSPDDHCVVQPCDTRKSVVDPHDQSEKSLAHESFHGCDEVVHTETFYSSEDGRHLEEGHEGSSNELSDEHADSRGSAPGSPPMIAKSYSVPNMGYFSPSSKESSPTDKRALPHCRSSGGLDALDENSEELQNDEIQFHEMENQGRDCSLFESITDKYKNPITNEYECYSVTNSVKDWTESGMDDMAMMEKHEKEFPAESWDRLPSKDFKIKRIEEWVSTIDLGESGELKESNEPSLLGDKIKKGSHALGSTSTAKLDSKSTHGMEVAKIYISSMTPTSTSAQLANIGLVVIPFLSAFVSLKVLNLSGNGIVRITAGALPRGLHALNLAKNKISTIEGLRELTRLRVLDLSYNRIVRIGHGLASCSSLKELYLAGNKISEVEGLHRLLKLNILDLRFNKISTAKCLGQLAANYSSLQAITMEGNPAQRNVGDEQLKKYLQGLLPNLSSFNKQPIKANSSKDVADRSGRSVSSHQFDRGLRSDHKLSRKGSLGVATNKASTSSSHAHRAQVVSSTKRSKDRHVCLPVSGTKGSEHRHHFLDLGNRLLNLKNDISMRRSRSEENLGGS